MALNTPHARRHLRRLIRRGYKITPGAVISPTGIAYTGTTPQAIALACGRRQAAEWGQGCRSLAWLDADPHYPSATSRGHARGRSHQRQVSEWRAMVERDRAEHGA